MVFVLRDEAPRHAHDGGDAEHLARHRRLHAGGLDVRRGPVVLYLELFDRRLLLLQVEGLLPGLVRQAARRVFPALLERGKLVDRRVVVALPGALEGEQGLFGLDGFPRVDDLHVVAADRRLEARDLVVVVVLEGGVRHPGRGEFRAVEVLVLHEVGHGKGRDDLPPGDLVALVDREGARVAFLRARYVDRVGNYHGAARLGRLHEICLHDRRGGVSPDGNGLRAPRRTEYHEQDRDGRAQNGYGHERSRFLSPGVARPDVAAGIHYPPDAVSILFPCA